VQATPSLLVYLAGGLEMGMGIWTRPISRSGEARRFTEFKFNMLDAALSPDGHWMTYSASDSGANEIWVQAFPAGERHRISTNGGINPAWSPNGRELFFLAREGSVVSLMAVDFTPGTEFKAGVPHRLFDGPFYITMPQRSWDVTPDGQHFIMVRQDQRPDEIVSKLNVVLNWGEELKKRAPRSGR
jgi:Tol biopolymer transport system component